MFGRETKTSAIVLLAVMVVGTFASSVLNSTSIRASGCPLHRHSPPSHTPAQDHSCCQSAYDPAVVQKLVRPEQVLIASARLDSSQPKIAPDVGKRFRNEIAAPGIPDSKFHLRV